MARQPRFQYAGAVYHVMARVKKWGRCSRIHKILAHSNALTNGRENFTRNAIRFSDVDPPGMRKAFRCSDKLKGKSLLLQGLRGGVATLLSPHFSSVPHRTGQ